MGGADVVLLGYDDDGVPYAVDYYLSTYEVCNYGSESKYRDGGLSRMRFSAPNFELSTSDGIFYGSCDDSSWGQSTLLDNVALQHAHRVRSRYRSMY